MGRSCGFMGNSSVKIVFARKRETAQYYTVQLSQSRLNMAASESRDIAREKVVNKGPIALLTTLGAGALPRQGGLHALTIPGAMLPGALCSWQVQPSRTSWRRGQTKHAPRSSRLGGLAQG